MTILKKITKEKFQTDLMCRKIRRIVFLNQFEFYIELTCGSKYQVASTTPDNAQSFYIRYE